jgi:membrane-associated phospholipid phosphatase
MNKAFAILLASLVLFAAVALNVFTGTGLVAADTRLAHWLHAHAFSALTDWMLALSQLHNTEFILGYVALLAVLFAFRRNWPRLALLLVAVPGGMLLNIVVKHLFHRVRPSWEDPFLTLSTYSFPSGHTAASTLLYGFLLIWLLPHLKQSHWRALALVAAVLMVALVALSRLYLGVHYLSDVLAGASEALAWLTLCTLLLKRYQRSA